ncbi:MAG: SOS response-associated peptidase, partial [Candidatus Cloacimonetes bacterium]|nr:SOS response-associated peptidase [Candidatus Cloacimonadota bacterium]
TILGKKTFKAGLQYKRCLIPVTGFYEWRKPDKQPFFIQAANGYPLLLAGIYDHWRGADGSFVQSCAIITTEANNPMSKVHDRMPVILESRDMETWLDHGFTDPPSLHYLLKPCGDDLLTMYPVSRFVNKISNNGEECLRNAE